MNNKNQRPLLQRAEELANWLSDRLQEIRTARAARTAETNEIRKKITACENARRNLEEDISKRECEVESFQEQIEKMVNRIDLMVDAIQHKRDQRDQIIEKMLRHESELHTLQRKWAKIMRAFGDGKVRRKRADLAKLNRRIQTKKERAERSALLNEPMTAAEIGMGITFEEKLRQQQEEEQRHTMEVITPTHGPAAGKQVVVVKENKESSEGEEIGENNASA